MQKNHWQKIEEIFNRVAVIPLEERRAFVEEICRDDEELCREILALINADSENECFLDNSKFDFGLQILAEKRAGESIGQYKLLKLIGQGGMGEVYLAENVENSQEVALKLLNEEALKDADRVRRFRQESRAVSLIQHPNVAQIYEIGETENNQFIAMEFVEGETLRERLKTAPPNIGETLAIAEQIISALIAAHGAGIIHRDLKPENVIIGREGVAKVLDFGLAKIIKPNVFPHGEINETAHANLLTDGNSTAFGLVFGTATYMSPEQARGQKTDERTDIWSFGVLLYEMIAGLPPFRGKTNLDVIAAVLTVEPEPLASFFPDAPTELSDLISHILRKETDQRPQNCQIVLNELRRISEQLQNDPALNATCPANFLLNERTFTDSRQATAENKNATQENETPAIWFREKFKNLLFAFVALFLIMSVVGFGYFLNRSETPFANTSVNSAQTSIGTNKVEAQQEYQKGIYIWNKRDAKEMPKALAHFQKAIELDPGFAEAYAGLANAYLWDGNPNLNREEKIDHARAAINRALAINPNSAEARTTLAALLASDWKWSESEREFRRAIEADPDYPTAHHWFSETLVFLGRDDEAVEQINKALELDPLSFAILNDAVTINWYAGRYKDAIAKAEKIMTFDPRYEQQARLWLIRLNYYLGNNDRARNEFERLENLTDRKILDADYAKSYAFIGERAKALQYLKKIEMSDEKIKEAWSLAEGYAVLGNREEAFKWLEVSFQTHHASIVALAANPDFDNLRDDPRYMNLLERMNLAEYWKDKINKQ